MLTVEHNDIDLFTVQLIRLNQRSYRIYNGFTVGFYYEPHILCRRECHYHFRQNISK